MEVRELRSLVTLAEQRSITRTAEKLHLSGPAIHKQLKLLEEELGVRLYEKVGRQLRLTPAAEVLLPHVKNLLAEYEAALEALSEWKGLRRGAVRIGAGPTFSSYSLPSLLEQFRGRFPGVELFIESGHTPFLIGALRRGDLDLAFMVSSELLDAPGLVVEAAWDFEIALVARTARAPRRVQLAALREEPFILYKKGSIFENLIDRYFAERGFHPRVIMRFDNAEAIKAMIRSGLRLSMLPMWTVEAEVKGGSLALVRQQEPPLAAKIVLVTRRPSFCARPVEAFIEVAQGWQWRQAKRQGRF